MSKYYNSKFYSKPIEVEDIDWEILVIVTDSLGRETIYSWYDVKEKNTESIYINKCLLWGFIKKIPKDVLIIWIWWWAFAKYLEDHIENINITWIDIDKTMVDIAKNELKVKTNDIHIIDAYEGVEKLVKTRKKYDLILIDVYWWNWEMPKYFQEESFFENIKELLWKEWTLSINFSNYDSLNEKIISNYYEIHAILISIFWKFYSHILSWIYNKWNVAWIYNLDKFYESSDFDSNYLEKVKNWEIINDEKIINDTFCDDVD